MDEQRHQLHVVLKRLMVECDLDDVRLGDATGVPFTTIARMRHNPEANPTASSLRPIAKYFGISISQLLGDEPLSPERLTSALREKDILPTRVPLISWHKITNWNFHNNSDFNDILGWVSVDLPVSVKGYAVRVEHSGFGDRFPQQALLIVDPNVVSPQSGDIVLIKLSHDPTVLLKEMIVDSQVYLKSVNPELKETLTLSEPYQLCGTVVETRKILHTESFSDINYSRKQPLELAAA
jgi:SOS-response transcriptional repressor LexA